MSKLLADAPQLLGDLSEEAFGVALNQAAAWAIQYRSNIDQQNISPDVEPGEVTRRLHAAMPAQPVPLEDILREFKQLILPNVVHWGHPQFLGYFGSTTTAPGIIGELLAATLNVSAMTWRTSPAATELESVVLDWLRKLLQLPENFFGVVYDTASVGTMHALAAARESLDLEVRKLGLCGRNDVPPLRIYASDQAHSSVIKAAIVLGIGEANVRRIPTDNLFQMQIEALRTAVEEDRRNGNLPMAVVATVGTTSATAVDPIPAIADFCASEKIWLHVDAAYGGAMALLPETRHLMADVERADSVIVNPHKWLFVPLDFSVLYTRHPQVLREVFSLVPEYLRGDAEQGELNYMDYGIQLGRRFRALKAWLVFNAFGESGLVARIREHVRLAKLFERWVGRDESFELLAPVNMAVICFRALNGVHDSDLNSLNRAIVEAVNATGRAYLTHTILNGKVAMRIAIGNVLTTEKHLVEVFELIRQKRDAQLESTSGTQP